MQPKRFSVKVFSKSRTPVDLALLIPIFQRWIQEHAVEGLLIDVADYAHVQNGPGVVLIGHEVDYSYDLRGGRAGMMIVRKRDQTGTLEAELSRAIEMVMTACQKLASEAVIKGLRFNYDEIEVMFLDRLNTPNTAETFEALRGSLQAAAKGQFQTESALVESIEPDPRKALTVRLSAAPEGVTA